MLLDNENENLKVHEWLTKYTGGGTQGFIARNIWRMKQFYETYSNEPKLSLLVTQGG